ncbi:MAG: hypothetical protein U1F36_21185 [Planctomycetota bacterium]
MGEARNAVLQCLQDGNDPLAIRCIGEEASVGGSKVDVDLPNLRWLGESFRRASIQGVDLDDTVTVADLELFAVTLQRCAAGTPRPLLAEWPGSESGVVPVPLLIVGRHRDGDPHGPGPCAAADDSSALGSDAAQSLAETPGSDLLALLADDPAIRTNLEKLQRRLDESFGGEGESREIDILSRIVDLARTDAAFDARTAPSLVARALAELEGRLHSADARPATPESAVTEIALRVAHRFFAPGRSRTESEDADALPTGRPEDELIADDLDSLIRDHASLPEWDERRGFEAAPQVVDHLACVLVSTLIDPLLPETPVRAARRLVDLAAAHPDLELRVLDEVIRGDGRSGPDLPAKSALEVFAAAGHPGFLLERAILEPEMLASLYPAHFERWLDLLSPRRPADMAAFARFLDAVDRASFERGVQDLIRSSPSALGDRVTRLVELCGRRAGSLLAHLVEQMPSETRQVALVWLSAQDLPLAESTALRVLPSSSLPRDHVAALCRLADGDHAVGRMLAQDSATLLRRFVSESADDPKLLDARLRAVRALGNLPSSQTRAFLADLAKGWSFASADKREIRRAAGETLRVVGG